MIGARAERLEDARLTSGRGRYLADHAVAGLCHIAILRRRCPSRCTFQKKLFAERNIRLPPRSRKRSTMSYTWLVTYSSCPAKTTRS